MKVALIFLAVVAVSLAKPDGYTTKYDNVDLDEILRNQRLLNNYVKCLLDEGNCTNDGKELKASLPDALSTGCSKCSEKQRAGSEKVIRYLVNEKPQIWSKLATKYDPKDEYRQKFQGEAKARGIEV
ncbi:ejaculatory bulb-specific protein 3 [Fopius arisanus]|uniref:Ejaculatory bulb-specific protein 3 n=1 Tax=Fopius arisanus TaxID=64838 RepID=A0A0C9RRW4_9HYME|nr:PREDICTED: ejaculatory bulb-specific protein 3 [Fopius arisanus]